MTQEQEQEQGPSAPHLSRSDNLFCLKLFHVSIQESERLEMVNSELKAQIEELRQERQQLMVMLNLHRPTCIVRTDSVKTPENEANPLLEQLSSDDK